MDSYYVVYLHRLNNFVNNLIKKNDYYSSIYGIRNIDDIKDKLDNIIDSYIMLNYIFKMSVGYNEYYDIPVSARNLILNKLINLRKKEYENLKSEFGGGNKK